MAWIARKIFQRRRMTTAMLCRWERRRGREERGSRRSNQRFVPEWRRAERNLENLMRRRPRRSAGRCTVGRRRKKKTHGDFAAGSLLKWK
jgi:hypothetical protein